jgi:ATP-dependent DNA ligase
MSILKQEQTFPEWVVPMAATLTQERFASPEWLFERKFDGIRMLAFKQGADVKLFSRNRLPQHYPSVAEAIGPEIVVQVSFIEWTVHGKLRHPRLVGLRYDKSPREVVRETW